MNIVKYMRPGDTGPALVVQIKNKSDQQPVDLTGATVVFGCSYIDGTGVATDVISEPAATNAEEGIITWQWRDGDLPLAGLYQCFFRVTFSGGSVETYPTHGFIDLQVSSL
jgi:hypothetical protein